MTLNSLKSVTILTLLIICGLYFVYGNLFIKRKRKMRSSTPRPIKYGNIAIQTLDGVRMIHPPTRGKSTIMPDLSVIDNIAPYNPDWDGKEYAPPVLTRANNNVAPGTQDLLSIITS